MFAIFGDHLAIRRPQLKEPGFYEIRGYAWSGRGVNSTYHFNGVYSWRVDQSGAVSHVV